MKTIFFIEGSVAVPVFVGVQIKDIFHCISSLQQLNYTVSKLVLCTIL